MELKLKYGVQMNEISFNITLKNIKKLEKLAIASNRTLSKTYPLQK
jgi:hypothetical protein